MSDFVAKQQSYEDYMNGQQDTVVQPHGQNQTRIIFQVKGDEEPNNILKSCLNIKLDLSTISNETIREKKEMVYLQDFLNFPEQWNEQIKQSLFSYLEQANNRLNLEQDIQERLSIFTNQQLSKYIFKNDKQTKKNLEKYCNQFSKTLNFTPLFLSQGVNINSQSQKQIKKLIEQNNDYKILNEYGQNIYILQIELIMFFFKSFFNKINSKSFIDILAQLLKNPHHSWTNRSDLSINQNKLLIKQLWLKENPLNNFKRAYNYKDTLERKKELDIQKIENYINELKKGKLTREELDQLRIDLENEDLQSFFEKTKEIKGGYKVIYPFMATQCPEYLDLKKQGVCLIQLKEQNLLALRNKLFEMVQSGEFSVGYWSLIQERAMMNLIYEAEKFIPNQKSYLGLRQWITKNLSSYFSIALQPKTLKEQVKRQLTLWLVSSKIEIKYSNLVNIVNELLEVTLTQVIISSTVLLVDDVDKLVNQLLNQKLFRQYCNTFKLDSQYIRKKAQGQIYKILDSQKLKLTPDQKTLLKEKFLQNPRASTIYETPNICHHYKQTIYQQFTLSKEIKDYIQNFEELKLAEKMTSVKQSIEKITNDEDDSSAILEFIFVNGKFNFQENKEFTVLFDEHCNPQLQRILSTKLKPQQRKSLKQLQKEQFFIELQEKLPQISNIYLNQCRMRLKYTIKNDITKNSELSKNQRDMLLQIIHNIIDSQDINAINKEQRLKEERYQRILSFIKSSKWFKLLLRNSNSSIVNQAKYSLIKLNGKIRTLYDHQDLVGFTSEQKMSVINSLIKSIDFEQLKTFNFLNEAQVHIIINFIKNSEEYKQYESTKNKSSMNQSRNAQLSSERSEKMVEKKKNQPPPPPPPRQSQKKQQQPPSQKIIPPNPQTESISSSAKKQELSRPIIQEVFVQQQKPKSKPLSRQQSELKKKEIVKKWMDYLAKTEKPLFKKERQAASANQQQFALKLLTAYPWTVQSVTFFQATNNPVKRKIIAELDQIIVQNGYSSISDDVNFLKTA